MSLLTRAAAASHEMVSSDTLSTTLELGNRIGQRESRAHAHRERSDGSEEGLELHDWAEKRLFGKSFWFVVLVRREKAGPVVSKTDGSSDGRKVLGGTLDPLYTIPTSIAGRLSCPFASE